MAKKLLILSGSPRRDGNCATLAEAVRRGAVSAGLDAKLQYLDDSISGFLRDCRKCRQSDGSCSIPDGYSELFLRDFLPAEGVIICSPIYWYGMSAQTKAFFDRSFCYYAASYPGSKDVSRGMAGKAIGLVLTSEETYPGAALGIIHQLQEFARYTQSRLVGIVRGVGNARGEVRDDPMDPVGAAERLGADLLGRHYSDYDMNTQRNPRVWTAP